MTDWTNPKAISHLPFAYMLINENKLFCHIKLYSKESYLISKIIGKEKNQLSI